MDSNVKTVWKLMDDLKHDMGVRGAQLEDWQSDLADAGMEDVGNILEICSNQASLLAVSLAMAEEMLEKKMEEEE